MLLASSMLSAQAGRKISPEVSPGAVAKATSLAETGHCREALPQLKAALGHIVDPSLKRRAGSAGVRCSMSANDAPAALSFLLWLNREFPHDPEVLYLTSHVYSDLAIRASNELLTTAPGSPQVHELNAEALETMGKWNEAAEEYRAVLAKEPQMPGIHYRIGRLLLSQPDAPPSSKDAAKTEFEEELRIDPKNAGAEFVLGELARQAELWPDAIAHFSRATQLDAGFADAYIGLGRALLGSGKGLEAVAPLKTAANLQPDNPAVHFQLATAYRRVGNKPEADREFALYKQAAEKSQQSKDEIKKQLTGGSVEQAPQPAKRP